MLIKFDSYKKLEEVVLSVAEQVMQTTRTEVELGEKVRELEKLQN